MTVTLMKSENNAFYAEGNSEEDPVTAQQITKKVKVKCVIVLHYIGLFYSYK